MVETSTGTQAADKIAAVPGVDVIFEGSGDDQIMTRIHDATLRAGKILAGPLAWKERPGYTFLMGPTEVGLLRTGAQKSLRIVPAP
jgi:hypothetical protein